MICVVFINCNDHNTQKHVDSLKTSANVKLIVKNENQDSIELTKLVRNLYEWHERKIKEIDGFKPLKVNPSDTLYTGIDLDANEKAIDKLKQTGFFADVFLDNYRKIALRMDKELRNGTSLWPEGELPTFNDDVDAWCNCQDSPVEAYWKIIKLTDLKVNQNEANFKWTWGDAFFYSVKAKKVNNNWKISYLQGFDMNYYNWEWVTKNKKH